MKAEYQPGYKYPIVITWRAGRDWEHRISIEDAKTLYRQLGVVIENDVPGCCPIASEPKNPADMDMITAAAD